MSRATNKYSDIKGGRERGPKQHKTHVHKTPGEIMRIASEQVVSTHPQNTVKNAATLMAENDVRRLPVIEAGKERLTGLVTAIDILDFLGGGPKYNIIKKDFQGNFLKAVNCPISKIMRESQYLITTSSIQDAADIILNKSSCIPVVENTKTMKVVAIVTERDMLPETHEVGVKISEVMRKNPITASPGMMLGDASKIMVRNQLRRLPVISEEHLLGVVTVFDILRFLEKGEYKGSNTEENLSTRVEKIMITDVVTLKPTEDLGKAVKLIKKTGIGGFPVVEGKKLAGILTTTDILRQIYLNS